MSTQINDHKVAKPEHQVKYTFRSTYSSFHWTHTLALHIQLCPPSRIRGGQAKVINICLTYWSKCATGKWEVRRWQTKSKTYTNSDKTWRVCLPPKALLREQLASVNYVKICEVTQALRPIRFKAAGHRWIYRCCTSQEHVPGQRKNNIQNKYVHMTTHTPKDQKRKSFITLPKIHYAWFVMRWGDSVEHLCHLYVTITFFFFFSAEVHALFSTETILVIQP